MIPTSFFLLSHLCSTNQQLTLIHNIFCLLNEHSEFSCSVSWKSNVFVAEINHYSAAGSGSNEPESRRSSRVSTLWLPGERELEVAAVGIWISAQPPPWWIRATQRRHIWSKHRYKKRFLVEPTRVVEKRNKWCKPTPRTSKFTLKCDAIVSTPWLAC